MALSMLQAAGVIGNGALEVDHMVHSSLRRVSLYAAHHVRFVLPKSRLVLSRSFYTEEDKDGGIMWTWSYPTFSAAQKQLVLRRFGSTGKDTSPLVYCYFRKSWFYLFTSAASDSSRLNEVVRFGVVVAADDFSPEKYGVLLKMFSKLFDTTGSPLPLLEQYLLLFTQGKCKNNSNGLFAVNDFDPIHAYLASSLKDVVGHFGIECIFIYTAILLKKKVLVYDSNLQTLLSFIRTFPAFAWHRRDWSMLFPWQLNDSDELDDLASHPYYIVGTTDPDLRTRESLYDVCVDIGSQKITVTPNAKDDFAMGKIHKEIANLMMRLADDPDVDNREFAEKLESETQNVLTKLQSLGGDDERLTVDNIKSKKLNKATERFLINLAFAENLMQT